MHDLSIDPSSSPLRASRSWRHLASTVSLAVVLALGACSGPDPASSPAQRADDPASSAAPAAEPVEWALAIHGGAGVISPDLPAAERQAYFDALEAALALGRDRLEAGDSALDVVEAVVRQLEDEPLFNAGKGAVFTHEGRNELDAAIMDGRRVDAGAVASLTTVKNPIRVARAVLESSRHVFLVGEGAEAFADEHEIERVDPSYFFVERRHAQWRRALEKAEAETAAAADPAEDRSTVGAVARDRAGNLAAATSTGGLTDKRFGRVGDVPIIGAGTYAANDVAAISCTGIGEQFMRHVVAHDVVARVRYGGASLQEAAEAVLGEVLDPGDGGLIAVGPDGEISMVFNSPGMFRGAADATGRFELGIWDTVQPGTAPEAGP